MTYMFILKCALKLVEGIILKASEVYFHYLFLKNVTNSQDESNTDFLHL